MKHDIDLKKLAERGRLSQREAEEIHACLMQKSGIHDGDAVIAEWNKRSPESPWGEDGNSSYIESFTDLIIEYMKDQLKEPRPDEPGRI